MNKIFIILPIATLFACSNNNTTTTNIPEQTNIIEEAQIVEQKQEAPDALSGATNTVKSTTYNGTLILPPQNLASITLSMGGIVEKVNIMPGEYVKKESVIAILKNPDFITLQQDFLEAQSQLEYLETEYKRQQILSKEEAASKKRFEQSKAEYFSTKAKVEGFIAQLEILGVNHKEIASKGIQNYLDIKAPISGYITNLKINLGSYINEGEQICDVINKNEYLLKLTAYEKDLSYIKQGDKINFKVNGIESKTFDATIMYIGQEVDSENFSLPIYAKVLSSDNLFRPGMYVSAIIDKK